MDVQTDTSHCGSTAPTSNMIPDLVKFDDTPVSQATNYVVSHHGRPYQFTAPPGSVVSRFICPSDAAPPGMSAGELPTDHDGPELITSFAAVPTMFETKTAAGDISRYFASQGSEIKVHRTGTSPTLSPRQKGALESEGGQAPATPSRTGQKPNFLGCTKLEGTCVRGLRFTVGDSRRPEEGGLGRNDGMIGGGGFEINKGKDGSISVSPYDVWKSKGGGTERRTRRGGKTGLLPTYNGSYSLVNVRDVEEDYGSSKGQSYKAGNSVVSNPVSKDGVQDLIDAGWVLKGRLLTSLR